MRIPESVILPPAKKTPTLYIACKLFGASIHGLSVIENIIKSLEKKGELEVLPFAYDFEKHQHLGNSFDVLEKDLEKVETADYMVVLLLGDTSDGRGMEVMRRMHLDSEKRRKTLILHDAQVGHSPFYDGLPAKYGASMRGLVFEKQDQSQVIVEAIEKWFASMKITDHAWRETIVISKNGVSKV